MPPYVPEVDIELDQRGTNELVTGRWRSRAVLNAMNGIKRAEMFENLRKANDSNTITKKLAVLNQTPNMYVKNKMPDPLPGSIS